MISWLTKHLFGEIGHVLLILAPWLWLVLCFLVLIWLFTNPLLFAKWWKDVAVAAVVGFLALWVWQHFAGVADLKKQNQDLQDTVTQQAGQITGLQGSITDYTASVGRLERQQRAIQDELAQARVGLDGGSIIEGTGYDPTDPKAATPSDRWNALVGLSDSATASFGGDPSPAAAGASPDASPTR